LVELVQLFVFQVLFVATQYYGRERAGLLGNMLNTDPMALRHLIPALTHFYIGKPTLLGLFGTSTKSI
jgi:hypothetical protein